MKVAHMTTPHVTVPHIVGAVIYTWIYEKRTLWKDPIGCITASLQIVVTTMTRYNAKVWIVFTVRQSLTLGLIKETISLSIPWQDPIRCITTSWQTV